MLIDLLSRPSTSPRHLPSGATKIPSNSESPPEKDRASKPNSLIASSTAASSGFPCSNNRLRKLPAAANSFSRLDFLACKAVSSSAQAEISASSWPSASAGTQQLGSTQEVASSEHFGSARRPSHPEPRPSACQSSEPPVSNAAPPTQSREGTPPRRIGSVARRATFHGLRELRLQSRDHRRSISEVLSRTHLRSQLHKARRLRTLSNRGLRMMRPYPIGHRSLI